MKRIPWLFGLYCLLLVWVILFKMVFSLEELQALVGHRSLNLIPFHYEDDMRFVRFHWTEVRNNILVFIPFGVYLRLLKVSGTRAVLIWFITSLALESGQYATSLGAFDITDLMTNTFGTALGVVVYGLFRKLLRRQDRADKVLGTLALLSTIALLSLLALLAAAN